MCVLILVYMCPHTTIHVSSYYYMHGCGCLHTAYMCVLILLYMCVLILLYICVSSYCVYVCPHTATVCVCPHTAVHMGELVSAFGEGGGVGAQERGTQGGEEGEGGGREERGGRLRQWGVGLSPRSVRLFVGISGPYNIVALALQVA